MSVELAMKLANQDSVADLVTALLLERMYPNL